MTQYLSMKQAAKELQIRSKGKNTYVYCRKMLNRLCLNKKINGALKIGEYWAIPTEQVAIICEQRYTTNS